jgi:peptide/nickel transport system permease protein
VITFNGEGVPLIFVASLLALYQLPFYTRFFSAHLVPATGVRGRMPFVAAGVVQLVGRALPGTLAALLITEMFCAWPGEGRAWMYATGRSDLALIADLLVAGALLVLAIRLIGALLPNPTVEVEPPWNKRWTIVAGCALGVLLATFFIGSLFGGNANAVDPLWQGPPLPPCFVDAKTCGGHLLGTDQIGRDVFARLLVGGRLSLGIGLIAVCIELAVGIVLGSLARYAGMVVRFIVLSVTEAISCIPKWPLVVCAAISCAVSRGTLFQPLELALLAAMLFMPRVVRIFAGEADLAVASRLLIPRALHDWAGIILVLATVDFNGYGVTRQASSWGNMLADFQVTILDAPWTIYPVAIAITSAVFIIRFAGRVSLRTNHEVD